MRNSLELWVKWVLANAVGFSVGILLGNLINSKVGTDVSLPGIFFYSIVDLNSIPKMIIIGLAVGLCIGTLEWLVIRRLIPNSGLWIIASVLGWGIGVLIRELIPFSDSVFAETLVGTSVGLMQWLILRKTYYDIGLWVVFSAIVNIVIARLIMPTPWLWPETGWWIYHGVFGLLRGSIMGCLLVYLVKFPNQEELVVV